MSYGLRNVLMQKMQMRNHETEIEKCERETGHARVPGTSFCRCTHVMDDGEEGTITYESMVADGRVGEFLPPTQEQTIEYLESEVQSLREEIAALTEQRDALKGEVERLVEYLENDGEFRHLRVSRAAAARVVLRRLGLALAGILLGSSLYAQAIEPLGPKMPPPRHVTRAISTITVKVVAHEDYVRMAGRSSRSWHITTSDEDSCVAWVDTHSNTEAGEVAAFKACRAAIDKAVDGAHDRAEKGGR